MDFWDDLGKEQERQPRPQNNGMNSQNSTDSFRWRELFWSLMTKSHHSYRLWFMLMTSKTSGFHSHAPIPPWGQYVSAWLTRLPLFGVSTSAAPWRTWWRWQKLSRRIGQLVISSEIFSDHKWWPFFDSWWPLDVSHGSLLLWDQRFWVFLRCF